MSDENKKNEYATKTDLNDCLSEQTQVILGAMEKRFDEIRDELKQDINNVQTLIDGYVKAQEDFKQEFVIMKEEVRQIKVL